MGDDKYFTIQIKGTAYRWRPIPSDDLAKIIVVMNMGASSQKSLKALMKVLAKSAGPEQWDAITDRYIDGEIELAEYTNDVLRKILKRQDKDAPATDDAE